MIDIFDDSKDFLLSRFHIVFTKGLLFQGVCVGKINVLSSF